MKNMFGKRKNKEKHDITSDYVGSVTGAVVGASIGTAVAGPAGAGIGAIGEVVITKIFTGLSKEFDQRNLSFSESQRIKNVHDAALIKIQENITNGKRIRNDDFFYDDEDDRSSAEEILEGTLLASQRENEKKKLIYLSNMYANIIFDCNVDRYMANHLIKVASDLTYRQLLIILVLMRYQSGLLTDPARRNTEYGTINGYKNISLASEIFDLYRKNILFSSTSISDAAGINPSFLKVKGIGELMFKLMDMNEISYDEEVYAHILDFLTDTYDKEAKESITMGTTVARFG